MTTLSGRTFSAILVTAFLVGMVSSIWHDLASCKRRCDVAERRVALLESRIGSVDVLVRDLARDLVMLECDRIDDLGTTT